MPVSRRVLLAFVIASCFAAGLGSGPVASPQATAGDARPPLVLAASPHAVVRVAGEGPATSWAAQGKRHDVLLQLSAAALASLAVIALLAVFARRAGLDWAPRRLVVAFGSAPRSPPVLRPT